MLIGLPTETPTHNIPKMDTDKMFEISADMYRYATYNDNRMLGKIHEFYKEGRRNPSMAMLIASHTSIDLVQKNGEKLNNDVIFLKGEPKNLIKDYVKNSIMCLVRIKKALKDPMINFEVKLFESKFKNLYPKTHKLRKKLIENGRVLFNETKPCLPTSFKKTLKYAKFF